VANIRIAVQGTAIHATASFGVADAKNLPSSEALVERADEALYRAKNAGRNAVGLFDPGAPPAPGVSLPVGDANQGAISVPPPAVSVP
jgi:hypothetical protein